MPSVIKFNVPLFLVKVNNFVQCPKEKFRQQFIYGDENLVPESDKSFRYTLTLIGIQSMMFVIISFEKEVFGRHIPESGQIRLHMSSMVLSNGLTSASILDRTVKASRGQSPRKGKFRFYRCSYYITVYP